MDPAEVTEDNLRLLFGNLSTRYSSPPRLEITVFTDVEQLAPLATGHALSGREYDSKVNQRADYYRDERKELFSYNPNYPKRGLRTVMLRGKE
jgi:hypothetical protein